jgi:Ca2+-binding EF-hand superfamily protein
VSISTLRIGPAIALGLAAPAFATAAPAPAKKAPAPATAEAPKPMSRTQFLSNVQTRFSAADANHDGFIDSNEVSAAQQRDLQQARATEQQRIGAEFDKLDTNHDGQLSKAEFMAAAPTVTPRQTAQQIIGLVDSNKDGKISLQEYEAGPLGAFNKIDSNHDGTVSAAEIQAAKAAPKK